MSILNRRGSSSPNVTRSEPMRPVLVLRLTGEQIENDHPPQNQYPADDTHAQRTIMISIPGATGDNFTNADVPHHSQETPQPDIGPQLEDTSMQLRNINEQLQEIAQSVRRLTNDFHSLTRRVDRVERLSVLKLKPRKLHRTTTTRWPLGIPKIWG
jgi:hypothetical protein